jgi:hypothetical protein
MSMSLGQRFGTEEMIVAASDADDGEVFEREEGGEKDKMSVTDFIAPMKQDGYSEA